MICDDEINLPHRLLLTKRQVSNLRKAFADKSSTDQKLKYLRWYNHEDFLADFLVHYEKTGLPLMKDVIKALAKCVLIPLGLNAAASVADAGIHKKILGSGNHPLYNNKYNTKNIKW